MAFMPPLTFKRRWYQFSLRALLLFVLLVSVGLSWFAVKMQQARRQRRAVVAVEKLGGCVGYDYEDDSYRAHEGEIGIQRAPVPPGPRWLRQLAGDDFIDSVVFVWLGRYARSNTAGGIERPVTDDGVAVLSEFPELRVVVFDFQPITDRSLQMLSASRQIRSLGLYGTQITDNGVSSLRGLPNLEYIDIGDTPASLQGIAAIRTELPSLKAVCIGAHQLEAAGGWSRAREMLPGVQVGVTNKPDPGCLWRR